MNANIITQKSTDETKEKAIKREKTDCNVFVDDQDF